MRSTHLPHGYPQICHDQGYEWRGITVYKYPLRSVHDWRSSATPHGPFKVMSPVSLVSSRDHAPRGWERGVQGPPQLRLGAAFGLSKAPLADLLVHDIVLSARSRARWIGEASQRLTASRTKAMRGHGHGIKQLFCEVHATSCSQYMQVWHTAGPNVPKIPLPIHTGTS